MSKVKTVRGLLRLMRRPCRYLCDYVFERSGEYTLRDGTVVRLTTRNDRIVLHEILIHKIYSPSGFEIGKGDVVLDVGAQKGMFTLFAAKTASRVYAFEPMHDNYEALVANIRRNRLKNVTPIEYALSAKNGTLRLYIDATNSGSHSLYREGLGESMQIMTMTLARFIKERKIARIDFLKLDCEGAEFDILLTLPVPLLKRIRRIAMEHHDHLSKEHNHRELARFLEKHGFSVRVDGIMMYAFRTT